MPHVSADSSHSAGPKCPFSARKDRRFSEQAVPSSTVAVDTPLSNNRVSRSEALTRFASCHSPSIGAVAEPPCPATSAPVRPGKPASSVALVSRSLVTAVASSASARSRSVSRSGARSAVIRATRSSSQHRRSWGRPARSSVNWHAAREWSGRPDSTEAVQLRSRSAVASSVGRSSRWRGTSGRSPRYCLANAIGSAPLASTPNNRSSDVLRYRWAPNSAAGWCAASSPGSGAGRSPVSVYTCAHAGPSSAPTPTVADSGLIGFGQRSPTTARE